MQKRNFIKKSMLKLMFYKKASKIDKVFTVDLTLHMTVKVSSIFVTFLEDTNFICIPLLET